MSLSLKTVCIDRYQLALDMLITAKNSSRLSVCSSSHAVGTGVRYTCLR